jgi:hypothetical protein
MDEPYIMGDHAHKTSLVLVLLSANSSMPQSFESRMTDARFRFYSQSCGFLFKSLSNIVSRRQPNISLSIDGMRTSRTLHILTLCPLSFHCLVIYSDLCLRRLIQHSIATPFPLNIQSNKHHQQPPVRSAPAQLNL